MRRRIINVAYDSLWYKDYIGESFKVEDVDDKWYKITNRLEEVIENDENYNDEVSGYCILKADCEKRDDILIVKIIKVEEPNYWYEKYIGQIFEVTDASDIDYDVLEIDEIIENDEEYDDRVGGYLIAKSDCEIIGIGV